MSKGDERRPGVDRRTTWQGTAEGWVSPGRPKRLSRKSASAGAVAVAGVICGGLPLVTSAQETTELLTTDLPYPTYRPVQNDHYGLKLGSVRVRYDVSVSAIFTDNRNYGTDGERESDFGLTPTFTLGLFYPINDRQKLQVDVGIGYQWWSNTDESDRFYVSPNSHIDYGFGIGNVRMRLSNNTSSSTEASSRPEFAGGADPLDISFNRLNNTTSLSGMWAGSRRLSLSGGYSFGLTRSMNDEFTSLDRDTHTFTSGAQVQISAPISAGLSASYSMFSYLEKEQNDGDSFSVGPTVSWQPTRTLRINANVSYTESNFDSDGTIQDDSDFSGPTFNVVVSHTINRYMNHRVSFGRSVDPGFESNFTDDYSIRYGLTARLAARLNTNLNFEYSAIATSDGGQVVIGQGGAAGEDADLYRLSLGAGYQVMRRANLGLTYTLTKRDSELADRNYLENRVTLTASYQF